jgi:demethylmenaquinone methyltransferase/2-methoxy-6-polyprenyl-1,4-benzoquinol methylase
MDKQRKIVTMFDDIAKTYDVANRVLSFGVDKVWRKKACDLSYEFYGKKDIDLILDVACGTGDMCDYWLKRADANSINIKAIKGVDPSVGMLSVAKEKLKNIEFIEGEATNLPVESGSSDIISISYGIRNVVNRVEGLKEFNRSLKDGGLLVILEFTKNEKRGLSDYLTDFYMKKILPTIGGLLSKNRDAYEYLPNSIDSFLTQDMLKNELIEAGFEPIYVKGFSMNISTLFIAKKVK